jgi:hypothetical protein
VHFGDGGVAGIAAAWKVPGQGNRLKPVAGAGPGFARVLGGRNAQPLRHVPHVPPPAPSCP